MNLRAWAFANDQNGESQLSRLVAMGCVVRNIGKQEVGACDPRPLMRIKWAILCLALASSVGCSSPTDVGVERDGDVEIRALVEQLASKNSAPTGSGWPQMTYPDDWDAKAQEIVDDATAKLTAYGKAAFPILLEHLDDERYSMTRTFSRELNLSVGRVCREIIMERVDVAGMRYKSRTGADGEEHAWLGFFSANYDNDLNQWWRSNQAKSLRQMQLEALQWRIAQEEKIGFPVVEPTERDESGGYYGEGGYGDNAPSDVDDGEWGKDYMAELNRMLRKLSTNQ